MALNKLEGDSDAESEDDEVLALAAKKSSDTAANTLKNWIDLQLNINCYIDSSKDPSANAANAPPGIRQLLERKEGIFRKHMMGKRVNFACRSVISPDYAIGTNEIGIPVKFARTLTYPTPVTAFNVEKMRNLVIRGAKNYPGAVWVEEGHTGRKIDLGKTSEVKREALAARLLSGEGQWIVGRQLENGDTVLMNRQVSTLMSTLMSTMTNATHDEKTNQTEPNRTKPNRAEPSRTKPKPPRRHFLPYPMTITVHAPLCTAFVLDDDYDSPFYRSGPRD